MVKVELLDDGKWIVRITSDMNEEEIILVGPRGEVIIRNELWGPDNDFEAWAGFVDEPDYPFDEEDEV